MRHISVLGTSSDAGKSTIAFALCVLLKEAGIAVTPFKAQNVSNNAKVCDEGGEIAVAQHFSAEAIGIETTPLQNPILLKSGARGRTHLIVEGYSVAEKDIRSYYADIHKLKPVVKSAFKRLAKRYECIVAEGAGSPVELNLMHKDLSNIYVAKTFDTKIIIVADIEKGGVFASIYGVYSLLPKKLRKNVVGVVINKFRGDMRLFDEGVRIIRRRFGIDVLGVVPYKPFNLAFEDSASLAAYTQTQKRVRVRVGVIALAHISNFNDFEPLILDKEVFVSFLQTPNNADEYDIIVIPGSKRVVEDKAWLKRQGWWRYLKRTDRIVFGICGGYELMHTTIYDPYGVESRKKKSKGLGFFRQTVVFGKEKILQKGCYNLFGILLQAFEIRYGRTDKRARHKKNYYGTFLHGIFESDEFRRYLFRKIDPKYKGYDFAAYKKKKINEYASFIKRHIDFEKITAAIDAK